MQDKAFSLNTWCLNMWGHLEFMYEAPNWIAPRQMNVYCQTVMTAAQRENRVSCNILVHSYANDTVEQMEKWATKA
jgi:hypothetical protein